MKWPFLPNFHCNCVSFYPWSNGLRPENKAFWVSFIHFWKNQRLYSLLLRFTDLYQHSFGCLILNGIYCSPFLFGLPYISGAMLELSYILIYGSWISADSLFKIQRRRSSSSSATMLAQWSKISEFNWKLCLKNIVFFGLFLVKLPSFSVFPTSVVLCWSSPIFE